MTFPAFWLPMGLGEVSTDGRALRADYAMFGVMLPCFVSDMALPHAVLGPGLVQDSKPAGTLGHLYTVLHYTTNCHVNFLLVLMHSHVP